MKGSTDRINGMLLIEDSASRGSADAAEPPKLFEMLLTSQKGYGLFAVQDIKRGTRIIAEPPLMVLPPDESLVHLMDKIKTLTTEQYAQWAGLAYHDHTLDTKTIDEVRAVLARKQQYSGRSLKVAVHDMTKMLAIFVNNGVHMGHDARFGIGLFPTYSRINHSCRPNVTNGYNVSLGQETVHAVRDIAAGEELVTSYIYNTCTAEQRRAQLLEQWGFQCECETCSEPASSAARSRRYRISVIDQGLAIFERSNHLLSRLSSAQGTASPRTNKEALAWAEELAGLLKEEGLVGDLGKTYRACSKYSLAEGQFQKAMAYARKELEIERICVGDETDHLEEGMQGAKFWIRHLETLSEQEKVKLRMNEKRNAKEQKKADKKAAKKAAKGAR